MEIRYITQSDDRMAISRIYEESWKHAYKDIIPQEFLNSIEEGKWVPVLDSPDWYTLVCVEDGKYIGTSSFCKSRFSDYPAYGEIISIYLLPDYTGKGYGGKLFDKAVSELKKQGYDKLLLWVLEDNTLAKEFYIKHNFIESDNIMNDNIGGKQLREVMYVSKNEK